MNGAIGIINDFINLLNKIPGVHISLIDQVTFGTTEQLKNEAEKQSRAKLVSDLQERVDAYDKNRDAVLGALKAEREKRRLLPQKRRQLQREPKAKRIGSPTWRMRRRVAVKLTT